MNDRGLGRSFWFYRTGQFISLVGDYCGSIALAWWILRKTDSALAMSSILAPAMAVKVALLPLISPLGDRISRKWIVIGADIWRCVFSVILAALVIADTFNIYLVTGVYVVFSIGTAFFNSVVFSIIPQLVEETKIERAIQQSEAVISVGTIIGGISGGLVVSFLSIQGAFIFDAVSFLLSAILALFCRTIKFRAVEKAIETSAIRGHSWLTEIFNGIRFIMGKPLLVSLAVLSLVINFSTQPLNVILPYLVKEARDMPPWFLGSLESSIGVGSILGALSVGFLCRKYLHDRVILAGLAMIGIGIATLSIVPNPLLPITMMFTIGVGANFCNIPIMSKTTVAIPDSMRSRYTSIIQFVCQAAAPLGVFLSGIIISKYGLSVCLYLFGGLVLCSTILLKFAPDFVFFFRLPSDDAKNFMNTEL